MAKGGLGEFGGNGTGRAGRLSKSQSYWQFAGSLPTCLGLIWPWVITYASILGRMNTHVPPILMITSFDPHPYLFGNQTTRWTTLDIFWPSSSRSDIETILVQLYPAGPCNHIQVDDFLWAKRGCRDPNVRIC